MNLFQVTKMKNLLFIALIFMCSCKSATEHQHKDCLCPYEEGEVVYVGEDKAIVYDTFSCCRGKVIYIKFINNTGDSWFCVNVDEISKNPKSK